MMSSQNVSILQNSFLKRSCCCNATPAFPPRQYFSPPSSHTQTKKSTFVHHDTNTSGVALQQTAAVHIYRTVWHFILANRPLEYASYSTEIPLKARLFIVRLLNYVRYPNAVGSVLMWKVYPPPKDYLTWYVTLDCILQEIRA